MQIDGLSFEKGLVAFVGFVKGYKETPGEGQLLNPQALLRFLGFGTQHISVGHVRLEQRCARLPCDPREMSVQTYGSHQESCKHTMLHLYK